MKKTAFLMAIVAIALTLNSCKDDSETKSKTNTELLTSKNWQITSKKITPSFEMGGFTISDIMVLETEEVRSYSYKFNSDGTVAQYDKSNQNISQTAWLYNADETQIIFNPAIQYTYPIVGDIGLSTMTVTSLSADQMIATVPCVYEGIDYLVTITFVTK